jgi:hypothetical protein
MLTELLLSESLNSYVSVIIGYFFGFEVRLDLVLVNIILCGISPDVSRII